jgi:CMP/dCMP kinase
VAHRTDLIITIDGPSGAGKSTIAKMLAQRLGYSYIDTGAMYRGVAYAYKTKNGTLPPAIPRAGGQTLAQPGEAPGLHDKREGKAPVALLPEGATPGQSTRGEVLAPVIEGLLKDLHIRFEFKKETKVFLDGINISKEIRDPEISLLASALSQLKIVREYLYKVQREIGKNGGVILEGRDTGSVVFPNAQIKIYLDADTEERAKRRHLELKVKGNVETLGKVKEEMVLRDKNDSERDIAPLVMPENAIYIDTTGIDTAGVMSIIMKHVAAEGAA